MRRSHFMAGGLSVAAGLFCASMIYLHPGQLGAPAWVAYFACAAFVSGGAAILGRELQLPLLNAWLPVAVLFTMLIPGAWIAFGSGSRECGVSLPVLDFAGAEALCRGAFGIGAIIVAGMLIWAIRCALRVVRMG
jgi:hypothetical protein